MRKESQTKAYSFIDGFEQKHPQSNLRVDVIKQWRLGNRGKDGDWRCISAELTQGSQEPGQS